MGCGNGCEGAIKLRHAQHCTNDKGTRTAYHSRWRPTRTNNIRISNLPLLCLRGAEVSLYAREALLGTGGHSERCVAEGSGHGSRGGRGFYWQKRENGDGEKLLRVELWCMSHGMAMAEGCLVNCLTSEAFRGWRTESRGMTGTGRCGLREITWRHHLPVDLGKGSPGHSLTPRLSISKLRG